jgi:hypothetical protein
MVAYVVGILEFVLLLAAAFGLSFFLLKREGADKGGMGLGEFIVFRLALGLGIIAYVTFLAAALGLLHLYLFIAVLMAGILLFFREIAAFRGLKIRVKWSFFGFVLLAFGAVNFFYVWFPPTFYDSMLYHLAVPAYYISYGGLLPWPTNFFANLPLNVEMVFMFSLLGKTVLLPKLISFASGLALLWLLFSWYRRQFSRGFSLLPLLLFYTIPQVGFLTATSKPDMLGLLFLFAGVRLFFYYLDHQQRPKWLILSALFWGLAIGSKYIFGFYLLAFFLALLFVKELNPKQKVFSIVIISLLVLACLLPWLVKNVVLTGNPVYPYLSAIFPNPYWSGQQSADFAFIQKRGGDYSLWQLLWYPIDIFIHPYSFGMTVVLGVAFLVFIPFVFFSAKDSRIRFLIISSVSAFVLLLLFTRVPRYFLTSFLLLAMPMANGAENLGQRFVPLKRLLPVLLAVLLAVNLIQQADLEEKYSRGFSFLAKKVTGQFKGGEVKYLYHLPYYRAAEFANRRLSDDDRLMLVGEERTFYLRKKFTASSFVDRNLLIDDLGRSEGFGDFLARLQEREISHVLYCPPGLERFGKKSATHRLSDTDRERLHQYLSHFRLVYRDKYYFIYELP